MNLIQSVLGFMTSLLLLSSCATKETEIKQEIPITLQEPDPLNLREVSWIVLSQDNAEQILQQETVVFGLNTESYENLAKNTNDIRQYLSQQKNIINAYKRYIND